MTFKPQMPHHLYTVVQRPLGLIGGIGGIIEVILFFSEHVALQGTSFAAALNAREVSLILPLSVGVLVTAFRNSAGARLTQVLVIYGVALVTAIDAGAGNITSLLFALLACGLAIQYRLVNERLAVKLLPFGLAYFGMLFAGLLPNTNGSILLTSYTVIGSVLVGFVYYLLFESINREQTERESALTAEVHDRTNELQKQLTESKRLQEKLRTALEEKQELLRHKETLFRELHHRTKNNMQLVSSMLNIESNYTTDPNIQATIANSQSRIHALALVHEHLYQSGDVSKVDLGDYAENLLHDIWRRLAPPNIELESYFARDVPASINFAIPFGLIINELVFNSFEHAFPGKKGGRIRVQMANSDDGIRLDIEDDGVGLPETIDLERPHSTGLQIIRALVEQIRGTPRVCRWNGTSWSIRIPEEAAVPQSLE